MKTLKILTNFCLFLILTSGNVFSQAERGEYEWFGRYTSIAACLGEELEGTITVSWVNTKFTHHEKGSGVLLGVTSGEEYQISYELNFEFIWHKVVVYGYTFPMQVRHNGKLVAIIHESYRGIVSQDNYFGGPYIVDRYIYKIECK